MPMEMMTIFYLIAQGRFSCTRIFLYSRHLSENLNWMDGMLGAYIVWILNSWKIQPSTYLAV